MVHVLLLVLKVLGITLLILLGLIILLVLMVLLIPLYYTIDAKYYEEFRAVGRVRWLCFVIDLKGLYGDEKFVYYLKSFGFTISTNDENSKHYRKGMEEAHDEDDVPVTMVEDDFDAYMKEEGAVTRSRTSNTELQKSQRQLPSKAGSDTGPDNVTTKAKQGILTKVRLKIEDAMEWVTSIPMRLHYKISEILSRILDFLADLRENISKLVAKKNEILKKLQDARVFLQKPSTKEAWGDAKKYLLCLWKHIKPRKFQGHVRFGMEDPASTGQVLGAVAALMPLYKNHIVVAPDFEQQIFEGELYAKGRVQIGFLLTWILKILLNRNLMNTIQKARTILGGNK